MDRSSVIAACTALRRELHLLAEVSGREVRTRAALIEFLRTHTTLTIHDCGEGFYAAHREPQTALPAIALRADYDALAMPDGTACHLCGHDGHAAALCAAAMLLEGRRIGRNIFFLFQPAEETGAGAAPCCSLFAQEQVGEIYGAHNLPGFPFGEIYTREGTFACASRGMTLRLTGRATHAAYPENGLSPAPAVGSLLTRLPDLAAPSLYTGMTLCTVIGVSMGEKAFGAAAADAQLWLTLRAEHSDDLAALRTRILHEAEALCSLHGLSFSFEEQDVFPSTENHSTCVQRVLALPNARQLDVPMRWSEDFGHYLLRCPGAFFGVGCGESHPPLHTDSYEYPDALIEPTAMAFCHLAAGCALP